MKNFSLIATSFSSSKSKFSIKIIVELSPCHAGFQYDSAAQRCLRYNSSDIVSCSGSMSAIKRGYWFGLANEKSTISICPNNYCDFICCDHEVTSGYYGLSPLRSNQCNSHRTGPACGIVVKKVTLCLLILYIECKY